VDAIAASFGRSAIQAIDHTYCRFHLPVLAVVFQGGLASIGDNVAWLA